MGQKRVHTPTVLQMEAVECGAAALAILLAYYGRWVPIEELRVETGVSRDGAKASNIVKAARTYGMEARGLKKEADEALQGPFPFAVFWNFNHFIVIEGVSGDQIYINDPASGPRTITRQEFNKAFTGVVLEMHPGEKFKKGGERRNIFKALKARTKGSDAALSYVIIVGLMLVVPGLLLPAFLKNFIDYVLIRGHTTWILPILVGLGLTAVLTAGLTYLQTRYLLRVQTKLAIASASQFFWHALRVPVVFYAQRYVGDVASRVQSCHKLAGLLSGPLSMSIVNTSMVFFYLMVMVTYSGTLTLISVGIAGMNFLALRMVQRRLKDQNTHLLNQEAKLTGASMAGLQAIETLKATGTEQDFFGIWSGYQTNFINIEQKLGLTSQTLSTVPSLLNRMNSAIILGAGGLLIMDGLLTIGGLVAFQALMGHFTGPIQSLMGFGGQLQTIKGDLDRLDDVERYHIDPVFKENEEVDVPQDATRIRLSGAVELQDVCFSYNPLDPPFIENFCLSLTPGKRVALVGASGSGKSTLGRLILGVYQPTSGKILFDGKKITEIPRGIFTNSVAAVDQEISMFEGSVRDNLTMWDDSIPSQTIVAAANDACIHDVIAGRPEGYGGIVAEGNSNFSGGQAQRLEIARALVRDPSVLILDEATSALDPVVEKIIDGNIRRRGCTSILVAHRLSTIRDCDEIIVLESGKIIERGTHDELMALDGKYAGLVRLQ